MSSLHLIKNQIQNKEKLNALYVRIKLHRVELIPFRNLHCFRMVGGQGIKKSIRVIKFRAVKFQAVTWALPSGTIFTVTVKAGMKMRFIAYTHTNACIPKQNYDQLQINYHYCNFIIFTIIKQQKSNRQDEATETASNSTSSNRVNKKNREWESIPRENTDAPQGTEYTCVYESTLIHYKTKTTKIRYVYTILQTLYS